MHPRRCWAIARFELNRLFFSKRGWVALAAFSLLWFFIFKYLISRGADLMHSEMFRDMAQSAFGQLGFGALYQLPMAELAIYWLIAIYIYPPLALVISSDQTASDRQRGTLRFLTLRSSRSEILFGRFVGQLLILGILAGATLMGCWLMGGVKQPDLLLSAATTSLGLWGYLMYALLPFVAFMALLNSFLSSSRQSLMLAIIFLGGAQLLVAVASHYIPVVDMLNYAIPGNEFSKLLSTPGQGLQAWLQPLLQSALLLAIAWFISRRSKL